MGSEGGKVGKYYCSGSTVRKPSEVIHSDKAHVAFLRLRHFYICLRNLMPICISTSSWRHCGWLPYSSQSQHACCIARKLSAKRASFLKAYLNNHPNLINPVPRQRGGFLAAPSAGNTVAGVLTRRKIKSRTRLEAFKTPTMQP